jgi:Tol biopolymer transport system component
VIRKSLNNLSEGNCIVHHPFKSIVLLSLYLFCLPACSSLAGPTPTATSATPVLWRISFYSTQDATGGGTKNLYYINNNGSGFVYLRDSLSNERPAWSPDGHYVALVGTDSEVYLMTVKDGRQTRLTDLKTSWPVLSPAWSPDSQTLAFAAYLNQGTTPQLNLYFVNIKQALQGKPGSETTHFNLAWKKAENLQWSPDGQRLALIYQQTEEAPQEIAVINVADLQGSGSGKWATLGNGVMPQWSPDSHSIVFASGRDQNAEIYTSDVEGNHLTRLTNDPSPDLSPAWSPDGLKIAFASSRDQNSEIYLMNPDGSGLQNLTQNPAEDFGPAWSPDGRQIAFISNRDGNQEIYLMNADGSELRQLAKTPTHEWNPVWTSR